MDASGSIGVPELLRIAALQPLRELDKIAIMDPEVAGTAAMKTMSARDAKNAFGMMIDLARAEPVRIEKHGRAVVVVLSVEEFERLSQAEPTRNSVKPTENTGTE